MLLPHNESVYEQLENRMRENGRCCVVMGTGVGKSYVTLEYITNHNLFDKTLIVSPRNSINASWKKLVGDKVTTITYQKLANMYDDKSFDWDAFSLIICDEVHHVGAHTWAKPIKYLINNKKKNVIGLTENPVRFGDGRRDVSLEFFDGSVAVGEDVLNAISKGILNPVTLLEQCITQKASETRLGA